MNIDIRSLGFSKYYEIKVEAGDTKVDLGLYNKKELLELRSMLQQVVEDITYMATEESIEQLAYELEKAYRENNNRENAIIDVLSKYPDANSKELLHMWEGIDAYVDINT